MNHVQTVDQKTISQDMQMAARGALAVTTENDGMRKTGLLQHMQRTHWNEKSIRQSLTTVEQALAPRRLNGSDNSISTSPPQYGMAWSTVQAGTKLSTNWGTYGKPEIYVLVEHWETQGG